MVLAVVLAAEGAGIFAAVAVAVVCGCVCPVLFDAAGCWDSMDADRVKGLAAAAAAAAEAAVALGSRTMRVIDRCGVAFEGG